MTKSMGSILKLHSDRFGGSKSFGVNLEGLAWSSINVLLTNKCLLLENRYWPGSTHKGKKDDLPH
ncbi:hypothetical protein RND71_030753 [Anisodus tanguticus]|uniref:Uncharacterized protein n=1 Tax=Anisodus tanguticus TaxID=243964 RepID=A0AAE1RFS9_9SOLA|nr:hypothetical protein RND71_030753 [Anisodus tanguticus]